jgi:hypothetical protein
LVATHIKGSSTHGSYHDLDDKFTIRVYKGSGVTSIIIKKKEKVQLTAFAQTNEDITITVTTGLSKDDIKSVNLIDALDDQYIMQTSLNIAVEEVSEAFEIKVKKPTEWTSFPATLRYAFFLVDHKNRTYKVMAPAEELENVEHGLVDEALITVATTDVLPTKNPIRLGISGSCYSRRAFTSTEYFNPDYKTRYRVDFTAFQSSLISFLPEAKTTKFPKRMEKWGARKKEWALTEFNKDYYEKIEAANVDYFIIDLWADIQRGYVDYGNNQRLSFSPYLQPWLSERKTGVRHRALDDFSTYFEKFKEAADYFAKRMETIMPNEKIIINRIRADYEYLDENRELQTFVGKKKRTMTYNMIGNAFADYLISVLPGAQVIDSRTYDIHADVLAPGNHSINHFESRYYKKYMSDLDKIVLKQSLSGGMTLEK